MDVSSSNAGKPKRSWLIFILFSFVLTVFSCGGSDEAGNTNDTQSAAVSSNGIEFVHNNLYSEDELSDALSVVDVYYDMVLDCAIDTYPELVDVISTLPASDLRVVVNFPDMFDPSTEREAFSCNFSDKGCAGTYNLGRREIRITPSLDALGHEMSHWVNHMLFGETRDNDPEDLSSICRFIPVCHIYSEKRDLISCRQ